MNLNQSGTGKIRSMARNKNHDDSSSRMSGVAQWSDLDHDALFVAMMNLGVVDFLAFGGVCKSWRSVALRNRNKFMASKPPMLMSIHTRDDKKECCLKDFEGTTFRTILEHSGDWTIVGYTCGYLILNEMKTRDFCLVNPITRHELHFPPGPYLYHSNSRISPLLAFSASISRWVFVFLERFTCEILYCIEGKGRWSHVSSTLPIHDIHAFKGKIYTINEHCHISEMRLNPDPNLTILASKNFLNQEFSIPKFISLDEKLFVMETVSMTAHMVYEVDFGEMKWVPFKETRDEYAFFYSILNWKLILTNRELWADLWSQYGKYVDFGSERDRFLHADIGSERGRFLHAELWYFPHECLKVDILND